MGYFANGTEGMQYEERYCSNCQHSKNPDQGCAVWAAHLLFNYDAVKEPKLKELLDVFIPQEGISNGECRMFTPIGPRRVK